jgi:ATP-dependent Clp protease protease subunit
MPLPNEHSARVKDPGEFKQDSFRRKNITDGVDIIIGKLKSGGDEMVTQTYRLKADKFTIKEAKQWLKDNNVNYISFEPATGSKDMENAILKIYGDIGETDDGIEGITSKSVSEFLDQHKKATEITVKINSRGGSVDEGWAIHDLLVNSGKAIKTIGEGKVYSIATIVFLAGSEREIMKNADGLIHNPFIPPYTLADQYESTDLLKIAESLQQEEAKILDFYAEKTGTDKAKLAEYMKEDTKLSAEDMLSLGFATKIIEPVKAYAFIKPKNKFIMEEKDVKTFGEKLDTILDKIKNFSRLPAKDQTLKDKDGKEFKLEKESGAPAVGDKAIPDGSFVMADGKTIVIANGTISEIKEPAAAKSELELANEKITKLQAELDAEKAKVTAADKVKPDLIAAEASFKAKETEAKSLITELQGLKNSWKPEGRTKFSSVEKVGDINLNKVRELMKNLKDKGE